MHGSKTAVHTTIALFNNYGSYKDLNKSGKPMKISHQDDLMMKQIAVCFPRSSLKKIHAAPL